MKLTVNGIEIDATNGLDIRAELPPGVNEEMGPITIVVSGAKLFVSPGTGCSITVDAENGGCLVLGGGRTVVADYAPGGVGIPAVSVLGDVDDCDAPVIVERR